MRLLPQSYRSQLHQGKEEEEAGSDERGKEGASLTHAGRPRLELRPHDGLPAARSSCSFAPHSPVCSPSARPPLGLRPSVRGVIIMDVSRGNAPFVDSFTVIIFLLARFTVNFGADTHEKKRRMGLQGEQGRDADVDHKTGWKRRMEWFGKRAKRV